MLKVHLWIYVDEATNFTVGHVLSEGQQAGNIDGGHVMEILQEQWISAFGRRHTLHNKEVHKRLRDMQIILDIHPGETSWQACL